MKIVSIIGSPHGMDGITGQLLQPVLAAAEKAGAEIAAFSLADVEIQPCLACDACHRSGSCSQVDGFEVIRSAIEAADGLVLASPNYIFNVTAQMKAFMDRCCGPLHLAAFEGKYGAAVVTSGGPGSIEVERYLLRFLRNLGMWTVGSVGGEGRQFADPAARAAIMEAAGKLGTGLVDAIYRKVKFPQQTDDRREFYERMKMLVTMRREEWPYEYEYWEKKGRV
jgi:multimeric flavodoxin WrbA